MKKALIRHGFSISIAFVLAACGGPQPPIGAPGVPQQNATSSHHRARYETLYTFKDFPNAAYPNAGVIAGFGVLYGTTHIGGASDEGTVYLVTTTGKEKILHSFAGGNDGNGPQAALIASGDKLYGTTTNGGPENDGTVFEVDAFGKERVLHSFAGGADGALPYSGLLAHGGAFYGTTTSGGAYGDGTVFGIDKSGKERVLYSFGASPSDGTEPYSSLIAAGGTLYGTTYAGGAYGEGTVFTITPSGSENVLYSFGASSSDGANPLAPLTLVNGALYGTTNHGGTSTYGVVFKVTTSGSESVIYRFGGEPDGANPIAGLLARNGALYGTTYAGGTDGCDNNGGCGTVFRITSSGAEDVLHSFTYDPDGGGPWGGVVEMGRMLYGAASIGGKRCGTIFRLDVR